MLSFYGQVEDIQAEYTTKVYDCAGGKEIEVEIHSLVIMGKEICPQAVPTIVDAITQRIAEEGL